MKEKITELMDIFDEGNMSIADLEQELLVLYSVVGRSELLKAFLIWLEKEGYNCDFEWDETTIEDYIKSL